MAVNYASLGNTAVRLLGENGVAAVLTRSCPGAYDPLTDYDLAPVVKNYDVFVVLAKLHEGVDDYDWQALREVYEIGRASKAYIAGDALPAGVEPEPGDRLTIGSDLWVVRGNNPIRPANFPILHVLFLTRGADA